MAVLVVYVYAVFPRGGFLLCRREASASELKPKGKSHYRQIRELGPETGTVEFFA